MGISIPPGDRGQRLAAFIGADRLMQGGKPADAEKLLRSVKKPFSGGSAALTPPTRDPESLSGAGKVYWQTGEDGLRQDLEDKALVSLTKLSENYPEFIPGHVKFAEAAIRWNKPEKAIATLDRAYGFYPDRIDILEPLLKLLIAKGMQVEASVAARQFALNFPEHPDAAKYKKLADDYLNLFRDDFSKDATVTALISGDRKIVEQIVKGESAFGSAIAEDTKQKLSMASDPKLVTYVNKIGQKLAKFAGRDEFTYEFYVVQDGALNAFALPGGKIFVNAGTIADVETEAELAGIISHEIAHTVFSHGYLKAVTEAKASIFRKLPIISTFLELVKPELGFSRSLEQQADILGTRILAAAGYSADGLYRVFDRWRGYDKNRGTSWLDTHPASSDRVQYLAAIIANRNYNRYAIEGIETLAAARGQLCEGDKNTAQVTFPQDSISLAAPSPSPTPADVKPVSGDLPLVASLTRENVTIAIDGVTVNPVGNFVLHLKISNDSKEQFGFVPAFIKVTNAEGKILKSSFVTDKSSKPFAEPGQTIKGDVVIRGQAWRPDGKQDMILEIKEGTVGTRVFRIPF